MQANFNMSELKNVNKNSGQEKFLKVHLFKLPICFRKSVLIATARALEAQFYLA